MTVKELIEMLKTCDEDKIWEGLGFVLQWAKYCLKR